MDGRNEVIMFKVGDLVNFIYSDYVGIVLGTKTVENSLLWLVHFTNGKQELCWEDELGEICSK